MAALAVPGRVEGERSDVRTGEHLQVTALFLAWREGDASAFDQLLSHFHPMVHRVAARLLAERADADDAVQETFWRLYRSGASLRKPELLQAWLYRAVVNVCRTLSARERRRGETEIEPALGRAAPQAEPERQLVLREAIEASLSELTAKEREAVVLRDVENLEMREVAKAMNVFEVTVRTHLSKGRLKLRESLSRKGVRP